MQLNLISDVEGFVYFNELFYALLKHKFAGKIKKKITPEGIEILRQ